MGIGFKVGGRAYTQPTGTQAMTESGTFTVPTGVTRLTVTLVGAGGSGGSGVRSDLWEEGEESYPVAYSGGGGGGGYINRLGVFTVKPSQVLSCVVGSGNTTVTIAGTTYTANKGGNGGNPYTSGSIHYAGNGGSGESGGGAGTVTSGTASGKAGGTNGADGTGGTRGTGGSGTGNSCYINGVLFSSGGQGGNCSARNYSAGAPSAGGANTGNGGGGGYSRYPASGNDYSGASGGTGTIIFQW